MGLILKPPVSNEKCLRQIVMKMEKSLFVEFFGEYPIIKVLDFLIENEIFDYSKKEIAENSGVSWNTLETFWDKLEEKEIIARTRKIGNVQTKYGKSCCAEAYRAG